MSWHPFVEESHRSKADAQYQHGCSCPSWCLTTTINHTARALHPDTSICSLHFSDSLTIVTLVIPHAFLRLDTHTHCLMLAGKVHEGMMSAATFVHCNTAAALESAARSYPGWSLVVTGHSMGGRLPFARQTLPVEQCPFLLRPALCCRHGDNGCKEHYCSWSIPWS